MASVRSSTLLPRARILFVYDLKTVSLHVKMFTLFSEEQMCVYSRRSVDCSVLRLFTDICFWERKSSLNLMNLKQRHSQSSLTHSRLIRSTQASFQQDLASFKRAVQCFFLGSIVFMVHSLTYLQALFKKKKPIVLFIYFIFILRRCLHCQLNGGLTSWFCDVTPSEILRLVTGPVKSLIHDVQERGATPLVITANTCMCFSENANNDINIANQFWPEPRVPGY